MNNEKALQTIGEGINDLRHLLNLDDPDFDDSAELKVRQQQIAELEAAFATLQRGQADPKRVDASNALAFDVKRARYCMALLEARLEVMETKAEKFAANWAEAGDGAHLVDQLLQIVADDDNRELLKSEIEAEIMEELTP